MGKIINYSMKKLNFGCRMGLKEGYDNVDNNRFGSKKKFDFNKFPYPIEENKYDYVYSNEMLEHLDEPDRVLEELWRICKPNAIIEIIVPYYNNKGAYSSMEHKHYFSDVTFKLFVEERKSKDDKVNFEIESLKLVPTIAGKFFPNFLRNKLSLFIGGLIARIEVRLRVLK